MQRRQWSCFLFIIINIEQGETSVLSLLMDLNIFFTCSDNSVPSDSIYSAGIYLFKVNNRNSRTRCEICSKLNMFKYVRHHWRRSGVFIVNFEYISHLLQVFLSFEHVVTGWVGSRQIPMMMFFWQNGYRFLGFFTIWGWESSLVVS